MLGFSDGRYQICRYKILIMRDNIHYFHFCAQLLNGQCIDDGNADIASADNMLYDAFGMSSEDILEKFRSPDEISV